MNVSRAIMKKLDVIQKDVEDIKVSMGSLATDMEWVKSTQKKHEDGIKKNEDKIGKIYSHAAGLAAGIAAIVAYLGSLIR